MNKIQGVSLPRSGHNMLVIHLKQYFGRHFDCPDYRQRLWPAYSKLQMRRRSAGGQPDSNFHYCEYYYSCRSVPCPDANNKFQKSHDFELTLPIVAGQKYLVQTRNPIGLLISWYEMRLKKNRETDSVTGWLDFVQRTRPFIEGFLAKWVPAAQQYGLSIDYDDYLAHPADWLTSAIKLFDETTELNSRKIARIVGDVRPAKDSSQFRYFDDTPDVVRSRKAG